MAPASSKIAKPPFSLGIIADIAGLKTPWIALTLKKGLKDEFFDRFNYEQYGGSPILGVNAPVMIGHGISSPEAIKNMILQSKNMVESKIIERFQNAFNS